MAGRTVEQLNALIVTAMRLGYWSDVTLYTEELKKLEQADKEKAAHG